MQFVKLFLENIEINTKFVDNGYVKARNALILKYNIDNFYIS